MIQRIQSVYLLLAIILVAIVAMGTTIFIYQSPEFYYKLNTFGVHQFSVENVKTSTTNSIPFYIATLILLLMLLFSMLFYKSLKTQLALTRFTLFLYFILLIFMGFGAFLGSYFTNEEFTNVSISTGFYLFLVGFILVALAVRGINKDKKLVDSVNRLR